MDLRSGFRLNKNGKKRHGAKIGRQYPWGEEFDKTRCNSSESGLRHTTPVTQYLNGMSPYGCYDMAGNVWEWCDDWIYKKKAGRLVIRGGSWTNAQKTLRTVNLGQGCRRLPLQIRWLSSRPRHSVSLCPLFFDPFAFYVLATLRSLSIILSAWTNTNSFPLFSFLRKPFFARSSKSVRAV